MNMSPDETKLALWLDDELEAAELAAFEKRVSDQPAHLAAREEVRKLRRLISAAVPASEEPPYPEFFNQRVASAIRRQVTVPADMPAGRLRQSSRAWFMPLAACAGMALAFWLGTTRGDRAVAEIDVTGAPKAIPVEPILYTPEKGVHAEWFASQDASATVIVLNGVEAIPDSTDFSETVFLRQVREIDATAGNHTPSETEP
jgi:anti-sigma factor RsiW